MQLGTFLPKNSLCSIHRALWRVPALSSLSFPICKMGRLRLDRYTTIIRSCNPKFSETDALESPALSGLFPCLGPRSRTRGSNCMLAPRRPSARPEDPQRPRSPPSNEISPSSCPHHGVGGDRARRPLPPPLPPLLTRPPVAELPRATKLK